MNDNYINTVRLLLAIAPAVFQSPRFAMKGGTALNLFVQDLPRLSVYIDVVFIDHTLDREEALQAIGEDLLAAQSLIERMGYRVSLPANRSGEDVKLPGRRAACQCKGRGELCVPRHRAADHPRSTL